MNNGTLSHGHLTPRDLSVCVCLCVLVCIYLQAFPSTGLQDNTVIVPYFMVICVCVCVCILQWICVRVYGTLITKERLTMEGSESRPLQKALGFSCQFSNSNKGLVSIRRHSIRWHSAHTGTRSPSLSVLQVYIHYLRL